MTGVAKNQHLQHVAEHVLDVAEVHGERGEEEREPEREDELHDDRQGQRERHPGQLAVPGEEREEDRQAEREVHEVRRGRSRSGRTSAGKRTFFTRFPLARMTPALSASEEREPGPRQDAAEEEEEVGLDVRRAVRQHGGEDDRVRQEEEQRVDEAPEEAEDAAAVAGLELARDEALDEGPVADERPDRGERERRSLGAALAAGDARGASRRGCTPGAPFRSPPRP